MRTGFVYKAICIGIILFFILVSSCTNKKCTSPTEPGFYLMKDYFPLNEGDQWTWEVTGDTIAEPFFDGDVNLGEPFVDGNKNGVYDFGEQYEDLNFNGEYDGPYDPWTPGIPYEDRDSNGHYDPPNGIWDEGEFFTDLDNNGVCNKATDLTLKAFLWFHEHLMRRESKYIGTGSDGTPWGVIGSKAGRDDFSNDSLGLRWHCHLEIGSNDLLSLKPIIIGRARIQVGDSVINIDTLSEYNPPIFTWISIFEAIEYVMVPAGTFEACLKFESVASGWTGNMQRYNGTSYQWYAKGVGLVKSEGPGEGEHWLLKSAKINSKNYP